MLSCVVATSIRLSVVGFPALSIASRLARSKETDATCTHSLFRWFPYHNVSKAPQKPQMNDCKINLTEMCEIAFSVQLNTSSKHLWLHIKWMSEQYVTVLRICLTKQCEKRQVFLVTHIHTQTIAIKMHNPTAHSVVNRKSWNGDHSYKY